MHSNTRVVIDSRGNVGDMKRFVGSAVSSGITPERAHARSSDVNSNKRIASIEGTFADAVDNDSKSASVSRKNGFTGFSDSLKQHAAVVSRNYTSGLSSVALESVKTTEDADDSVPLPSTNSIRTGRYIPQGLQPLSPAAVRPTNSPSMQPDAAAHAEMMSGPATQSASHTSNFAVTGNHRWYHGRISREEAEELLMPREDGLFIVRESTNFPGDYTLCVCFQGKIEHYRIINDHSPPSSVTAGNKPGSQTNSNNKSAAHVRLTVDEEEYFDTLGSLVRHYTRDADGLCTNLRRAVPRHDFQPPESSPTHIANSDEGDGAGSKFLNVHAQAFKAAGWMIAPNELKLGESLGCGEFADVNLAVYQSQKVAVKTLKQQEAGSTQALLTEASLMTSLRHPNLVSLCGICITSDSRISLVTEFMSQGSLIEYLRSRGRHKLTKRDLLNFASDTCAGMAYLESRQFVHRDLAARNVLLNNECTAKVADFGLARNLDLTTNNKQTGGGEATGSNKLPVKWSAPEALRRGEFSNKSDVWSFGILLWELFSFGRVPYPRIAVDQVERLVAEKGYRMEAPEECPDQIFDTMKRCWNIDPAKRPTFAHMLCYIDELRKELI